MNVEDTIDRIVTLVRELAVEAERRGEQKALDRIRAAIGVADGMDAASPPPPSARPRQVAEAEAESGTTLRRRAPKGSVGNLVDRSLAQGEGLTLGEIGATAQNDLERMIAGTSIRAHLKKGEASGLYREEAGRWFRVVDDTEASDVPQTTEPADPFRSPDGGEE